MTTATALPKALRQERDREVTYVWRSPKIDIKQDHSADLWGEQIELEFDHNAKRKQYEATIRRVLWQPSDTFTITSFMMFDRENYPSVCFATKPVGRYGDKSFAEFEKQILDELDDHLASTPILRELLSRTLAY
jgi:hypothetical protein